MNKNQKIAFWAMYISFCVVGTMVIDAQGAFNNIDTIGVCILVAVYLVIAFFIRLFIKSNAIKFE